MDYFLASNNQTLSYITVALAGRSAKLGNEKEKPGGEGQAE
jgi:hypothetical protein